MMRKRGEFQEYFDNAPKLGLKERITSIQNRQLRVNDEKFDKIKRATKDMSQDMLLEMQRGVNQLKKVINEDLTKMVKGEESHDKNYFKFKE